MKLEIKYVTMTRRKTPHQCISHVGGRFTTGKPWHVTVAEAVANIETGLHHFFIVSDGRPIEVVVAAHKGNKYLKAADDGDLPDRLLALNPIPVA